MARTANYGITLDLIPEAVQKHVPKGIAGVELAKWYMAFEAGRRLGEESGKHGSPELGFILQRLDRIDSRLDDLGQMALSAGPVRPRQPTAPPWHDPLDDEEDSRVADPRLPPGVPIPPADGIALSDGDMHQVSTWLAEVMESHHPGDTEKLAQAMDASKRLLLGWVDRPDGTIIQGPPWTSLPSGGFQGIIYAMLSRRGLVPPPPNDEGGPWTEGLPQ